MRGCFFVSNEHKDVMVYLPIVLIRLFLPQVLQNRRAVFGALFSFYQFFVPLLTTNYVSLFVTTRVCMHLFFVHG